MAKVKFKRNTKSSREIRRIAEREQGRERRQQYIEEFWKLPPDIRAQRIADNEAFQRISKNGITIEDMHMAEEEAYGKGITNGKNETVRTCFAAFCLALNELHGFDSDQCMEVLNNAYDKLTFALNSDEAIQEVYDIIGLEIKFNDDVTEETVVTKGV